MTRQLNPDRRSRQVRSYRPRAVARAEGRKKLRRLPRWGGDVYTRTHGDPVWRGRTRYTAAVYQRVRQARRDHVDIAGASLMQHRSSCGAHPWDDVGRPGVEGPMVRPPTDAERAQERVLEQRWRSAERAFKRWEAKRVQTSSTPVRTSLIG